MRTHSEMTEFILLELSDDPSSRPFLCVHSISLSFPSHMTVAFLCTLNFPQEKEYLWARELLCQTPQWYPCWTLLFTAWEISKSSKLSWTWWGRLYFSQVQKILWYYELRSCWRATEKTWNFRGPFKSIWPSSSLFIPSFS